MKSQVEKFCLENDKNVGENIKTLGKENGFFN